MDNPTVVYWMATIAIGLMFFNPFISTATKPSTVDEVKLDVANGPVTAYIPAGVGTRVYAFNSGDDLPPDGSACEIPYQAFSSKDGARVAKCLDGKWRIFTIPKDQ